MQGKDPFLALLGLFILSTTFFFCGAGLVPSPPPVALENSAEISPPAPDIVEPLPSSPPLPPVVAPGRAAMMSGNWICWFWTLVGAGLLGWVIKGMVLGPVIDDKRREVERLMSKVTMLTKQPPEVRTVEKRIEVPVERVVVKRIEVPVEKIVEKLVEVPIEKIVDRPVDNPEQLVRIKALENEVAAIAGLLAQIGQIAQLQDASSQTGEKVVEVRAEAPVDSPEQLARIKALEDEMGVIADLRAQIAELQAASSQVGEKVVARRVETPTETHREVSIDKVNEPSGDGQVVGESPDDLKQIRGVGPALERFLHKRGVFWFRQVATWSQADIDKFEFLLPNFSGRIQRENWVRSAQVEHYKKYQQWLGEGEPPSESPNLRTQVDQLQAASSQAGETGAETLIETRAEQHGEVPSDRVSEPAVDRTHASGVASSEEGPAVGESPDDLKQIRGVGPALERFLHKRGVFWFRQVATWSQADIDKFEFLLPNFSGRIQRENWVRSAQVEYYKKYQQWLGEGEPPSESLDLRTQVDQLQAASSEASEEVIEKPIETPTERMVVQNGDALVEAIGESAGDLDRIGAVASSEEGQTGGELPDDLKQIRGVGPALERFLHKRGVFWFRQMATWSQADIDKFEFLLPNFSGRIQRENWVRSAQVEYYKKYKQWLGEDGPPSTTPETPSV